VLRALGDREEVGVPLYISLFFLTGTVGHATVLQLHKKKLIFQRTSSFASRLNFRCLVWRFRQYLTKRRALA
jgi:hypothetical protein